MLWKRGCVLGFQVCGLGLGGCGLGLGLGLEGCGLVTSLVLGHKSSIELICHLRMRGNITFSIFKIQKWFKMTSSYVP